MSYSPDESIVNEEVKKLGRQITVCQKVSETLTSDGWRDILEPLIDRMITDTVGGKIGDTWVSGKLDRARTDERREFYIGYKQALIDFLGRARFHLTQLPVLEEKARMLIKEKEQPRFIPPMGDSRYAP